MINPVNNNTSIEYKAPANKVTSAAESSEHFSMKSALEGKNSHEGVIYEPSSDEKSEASARESSKKQDTFDDALSEARRNLHKKEDKPDQITELANNVWEGIRDFFVSLWNNIRKIFGNLWDSKPIGEGLENMAPKGGSKTQDKAELPTDPDLRNIKTDKASESAGGIDAIESSRDERIRKALKEGDKDEFRSLISEEGSKTPARSTSMLTTYNSKGKINELNASDENKILHGNRGVRKL